MDNETKEFLELSEEELTEPPLKKRKLIVDDKIIEKKQNKMKKKENKKKRKMKNKKKKDKKKYSPEEAFSVFDKPSKWRVKEMRKEQQRSEKRMKAIESIKNDIKEFNEQSFDALFEFDGTVDKTSKKNDSAKRIDDDEKHISKVFYEWLHW